MYCSINRWVYFPEKSTLCNNFVQKGEVGLFSRVGLFSGDYGIYTYNNQLFKQDSKTSQEKMDRIDDCEIVRMS